jgi:hypothetical protein
MAVKSQNSDTQNTYILNDHHKEGQLDAKGLLRVSRACDISGRYVGTSDLNDTRLNVLICDTLDVTILDCRNTLQLRYVTK